MGRRKTLLLAVTLIGCVAGTNAAEFVAPYVDTVKEDVELILELAGVDSSDYLIDLGSGDGRFVIGAAKRGALAHGIELNPDLVELAKKNAIDAGVADKAAFIEGDIFKADISAASVVTLYLFPDTNLKLRPKLLAELRPGTTVVSNSFHMGEWEPDRRAQGRTSGGALLWIIPANVRGRWRLNIGPHQFDFTLQQEFQKVAWVGAHNPAEGELKIGSLQLLGSKLRFSGTAAQGSYVFDGRVEGDIMRGFAQIHGSNRQDALHWEAHRLASDKKKPRS